MSKYVKRLLLELSIMLMAFAVFSAVTVGAMAALKGVAVVSAWILGCAALIAFSTFVSHKVFPDKKNTSSDVF